MRPFASFRPLTCLKYLFVLKILLIFLAYRLISMFDFSDNSAPERARTQQSIEPSNLTDYSAFMARRIARHTFVYSAYLDLRRFSNDDDPKIRMMAITTRKHRLSCHFNGSSGHIVSSPVAYYETAENHDAYHKIYILSCSIPRELLSLWNFDTFFLGQKYSSQRTEVRISNVISDDYKPVAHKFNYTVCVPTIFGNRYSPQYLVEYIEIKRMLGAEHFYFYFTSYTEKTYREVISYYKKRGLLTTFVFNHPLMETDVWNYGQALVANDCVYRNAGISKYVLLVDLDEYFVPYAFGSWSELFESNRLWERNYGNMAGYAIQTYHFDWIDTTDRIDLINRTFVEGQVIASDIANATLTKCVVRPERIFEMGIHHVSKVVQDAHIVEKLDTKWGALHHYTKQVDSDRVKKRRLVDLVQSDRGFRERLHIVLHELKLDGNASDPSVHIRYEREVDQGAA